MVNSSIGVVIFSIPVVIFSIGVSIFDIGVPSDDTRINSTILIKKGIQTNAPLIYSFYYAYLLSMSTNLHHLP